LIPLVKYQVAHLASTNPALEMPKCFLREILGGPGLTHSECGLKLVAEAE